MRVAGKIAIGSGLAVVLLLGVLAWDLSLVESLARSHQELSAISFRASSIALEQSRVLNQIDEFTRKYWVTGDPAYADRLAEHRASFARQLAEMSGLELEAPVRSQLIELAQAWEGYRRQVAAYRQPGESSNQEESRAEVLARLERVRVEVDQVGQAAQQIVAAQSVSSMQASQQARRVSWAIVATALVPSIVILWLTIRSINRPLKELTRGTRAVADGEFSVQLPSRGRDELSGLADSFNRMVQRLGEAERVKKNLLSHVSHELKTPLASMQETNELLLEEIPGRLNMKQRRFLLLNLESSRRLSAMISKLLDLSRMEAGALDYDMRCHDLTDLAKTTVAGFEARARDVGVEVLLIPNLTESVPVECDGDRMIQVIENLTDNALKFSPPGGSVEVTVSVRREPYRAVLLEVADQGPGIPDEEKSRVFERFHRLNPAAGERAVRGVGLGLAICREIVEAHQGEIGVRDAPGTGSVFFVTLPTLTASLQGSEGTAEAVRSVAAQVRS